MHRKKKELPTKPFFTRFLEQQSLENVIGGGGKDPPFQTLKYPSDSDEV
jgi:Serine endopeptidase inhibitors